MSDDLHALKARLRKAEEIMEQVLDENRDWRIAVISKLINNTGMIEEIFSCVRDGGLPDEFVEWHLYQVAKDRDRWKKKAEDAESKLKKILDEYPWVEDACLPREPELPPIEVSEEEFEKDRLAWLRKAGPNQVVVVVGKDGHVKMAAGGRLR